MAMGLVAPTDIENIIEVTEQGRAWYADWIGGDQDGTRADFRDWLHNLPFVAVGAATPDQLRARLAGIDAEQIEAAVSLMTEFDLFAAPAVAEDSNHLPEIPPAATQASHIGDTPPGGEATPEANQQNETDTFAEQKTDTDTRQTPAASRGAPSSDFSPDASSFNPDTPPAESPEADPYASPFALGAKGLFGSRARNRPQPTPDEPPTPAKTSEPKAAEPVDSGLPAPGTASGGWRGVRAPRSPAPAAPPAPDSTEPRGPRSGWMSKRPAATDPPPPMVDPQASDEPRPLPQRRQEAPDPGSPLDKFRYAPKEPDTENSRGMTRRTEGASDLRPVGPRSQKPSSAAAQPTETETGLPAVLSYTFPDGFKVEISRELYTQYLERHQGDIDAALLALRDLFEQRSS